MHIIVQASVKLNWKRLKYIEIIKKIILMVEKQEIYNFLDHK